MELNSIINNDNISNKMQDIYKYIEKHEDEFDKIFNNAYNDFVNLYNKVEQIDEDTIEIFNVETEFLTIEKEKCYSILVHHANIILDEYSYLLPYVFKINNIGNTIQIIKKR